MADIAVFFLEPTDLVRVSLRRFTFARDKKCRESEWGHDASAAVLEQAYRGDWISDEFESGRKTYRIHDGRVRHEDPRWPQECSACGDPFQLDDEWQVNADTLYSGCPDGNLYTLKSAPVGAMWDAEWMSDFHRGGDGICLVVRTPGGEWMVDSRASNCTLPGENLHKCWIRHGDPQDPQGTRTGQPLHVDKNGPTCSAGAGSIQCGGYHGFLHHGHLTSC